MPNWQGPANVNPLKEVTINKWQIKTPIQSTLTLEAIKVKAGAARIRKNNR